MIRATFRYSEQLTREALQAKVLLFQKKIAFDVLEGVVIMTPVDTGRAKGNWFVTLTAPSLEMNWEKKDKDGGGTINAGKDILTSLPSYGAIYLTNNLPYITALEKGHSTQAPAGMVVVTLDRVTAGLR